MASETILNKNLGSGLDASTADMSFGEIVRQAIAPLASLKFTVALFAMAIFIIFAGTLAQVEKDIWEVVDQYFRVPVWPNLGFAWIDFQLFFPKSFFPGGVSVPGGFYFPGGWLIGAMMFVNLVAAHSVRFTVQARGTRLAVGLVVLLVGALMTWIVIASGSNKDGIQEAIWSDWSKLWLLFKIGLGALWVAAIYSVGVMSFTKMRASTGDKPRAVFGLLIGLGLILTMVVGWILVKGEEAQLNDSSMRILWQLLKAEFAALVLLAGCVAVFKKRAGIVLLHGGIGLMMFSEFLVGVTAVEQQITLKEGEVSNYARDIRSYEVAVIDSSNDKEDRVTVIPDSMFPAESTPDFAIENDQPIQHADLPFDVTLTKYYRNSNLREWKAEDGEVPSVSPGPKKFVAIPAKSVSGTDMAAGVNIPTVYARFTEKGTGKDLGTHLLNLLVNEENDIPEKVTVDGKTYDVALRFKREYKPYSVRLVDVRKDDYKGTSIVKNYSSEIRLVDDTRNVDFKRNIWMNNPLRFGGETFYQSGYAQDPNTKMEQTTLQVVTNSGWMIPYVSCMIVATGLLSHFWLTLMRFLNRGANVSQTATAVAAKDRKKRAAAEKSDLAVAADNRSWTSPAILVPLCVTLFFAAWLGSKARVPTVKPGEMNLYEAGKIPVMYEGRIKPLDTLAANSLQIVSNKQTFVDDKGQTQPAIRWFLDAVANPAVAEKHNVFKIDNLDVLKVFDLPRRKTHLYSVADMLPKIEAFEKEVNEVRKLDRATLNAYQRKLLELDRRIRTYTLILAAFKAPELPDLPTREELATKPADANNKLQMIQMILAESRDRLQRVDAPIPLAVPLMHDEKDPKEGHWEAYASERPKAELLEKLHAEAPNMQLSEPEPAVAALHSIFSAYGQGNASAFNDATASYLKMLKSKSPAQLDVSKTNFEAYFNHLDAFFYPAWINVIAFVLAFLALFGWKSPLNRTAFCLIAMTFVIHTFALISRMYLTDRWGVTVTNLYSSAIFIGWAGMLLGLVLEVVFKLGFGNIIAAVAGFSTLLIAHFLSLDGDTLIVMQAVLDTNFWLATHVTCVTLGYATTFVAGLLGVLYIVLGVFTPKLSGDLSKALSRMIYGSVCFAIFFSFVGTVLGGLWADDSWGRFWGWDPKENGALIIVLWNALILHARWGGMVKDRGLAVLAVVGNIVTSWSWFGVNELGVGLHSYGFTEGVLLALGLFVVSQLMLIGVGCLPKTQWWSFRQNASIAKT